MTVLLVFSIFLSLAWFFSLIKCGRLDVSFLDREHCDLLKGYAALAIIWGHIAQYLGINGCEYPAGIGVSLFIILSGYGIEVSFQKQQFKCFWRKRLTRVYLPFAFCDLLALILTQRQVSIRNVLLNFALLQEQFPFIWYFRFIFISYIIFYISARMFSNKARYRLISVLVLFSLWFVLRSTLWVDETPFLEPRQMFCFPLGVFLAQAIKAGKVPVGGVRRKHALYALFFILGGTLIYAVIHLPSFSLINGSVFTYNILAVFTCMPCAVGLIWLIYSLRLLQSVSVKLVGLISYELYITQRYFINHFGAEGTIYGLVKFILFTTLCAICLHWVSTSLIRKAKWNNQ